MLKSYKRVLQLSTLALVLVPTAAFADAINVNLAGGNWSLNGGNNTLSLTSGSTTLLTGTFSTFIPFSGSAGSSNSILDIGSSSFSCTSCLSANESFQFGQGNGHNVVYLSGNINDSGTGDTGTFSAVLDESGNSGHGGIVSGSIALNLDPTQAPAIPTPEPSTWVLMAAGLVLLASTALVRRMGWFAPVAAEGANQS
jgi:hypothetical protein